MRLFSCSPLRVATAIVVITLGAVLTTGTTVAVEMWLSETGQVEAGVESGHRLFWRCAAIGSIAEQKIHLWAQLDGTDPTDLTAFDLNVISSDSAVIEFAEATVHNPVSANGDRWELVDEVVDQARSSEMIGFGGFNLSAGTGIGASGVSSDVQYDSMADAWLLATLTYNVVLEAGSTSTNLYLEIGSNGIGGEDSLGEAVASSSINVLFGDDHTPLNGDTDRNSHAGQNSDGEIEVGTFDGDHDASCSVGLSDLNLVLFNWNQLETALPPDWINNVPSSPATVGLNELNAVLFNWGDGYPLLASPIPEPHSAIVAWMTFLGALHFSILRSELQVVNDY